MLRAVVEKGFSDQKNFEQFRQNQRQTAEDAQNTINQKNLSKNVERMNDLMTEK